MNITLHIEAGSPIELQDAIIGLAGIAGATTQIETEKAKRVTRGTTKQEKQQDPDPDPAAESDATKTTEKKPDVETEVETRVETEAEEIPTVVDLRAKAQEKGTTPEGKKEIKALLNKFESKSISDVPEEKRVAFMRELEAL